MTRSLEMAGTRVIAMRPAKASARRRRNHQVSNLVLRIFNTPFLLADFLLEGQLRGMQGAKFRQVVADVPINAFTQHRLGLFVHLCYPQQSHPGVLYEPS